MTSIRTGQSRFIVEVVRSTVVESTNEGSLYVYRNMYHTACIVLSHKTVTVVDLTELANAGKLHCMRFWRATWPAHLAMQTLSYEAQQETHNCH